MFRGKEEEKKEEEEVAVVLVVVLDLQPREGCSQFLSVAYSINTNITYTCPDSRILVTLTRENLSICCADNHLHYLPVPPPLPRTNEDRLKSTVQGA